MNPTRQSRPAAPTDPRSGAAAATPAPSTVESRGPRSEPATGATAATGEVTRAFSTSMVVSGIRCLLAYIVLPWLLPLFGVARGVGPAVGLAVGIVAIGFNIASIRRFMRSGHRYRYWIATINVVVIGMLSVLVVRDIVELAS